MFLRAEQTGLKLAIIGRTVALVLSVFAVLGLAHYALIGTRFDRRWVKYVFITLDIAIISVLVATQPLFPSAPELPAANAFKAACAILACVVERKFAGQGIRVRIGINTGFLVAGNVAVEGVRAAPWGRSESGRPALSALQGTLHLAASVRHHGEGAARRRAHRRRKCRRARPRRTGVVFSLPTR